MGGKIPIRGFRDIIAWQRSVTLTEQVYAFTAEFPSDERFGLVAQLRRAAVSVPSNIAEGYGLGSRVQFLRHLRIARGSLFEVATQIELAERLLLLAPPAELHETMSETHRLLLALMRSLESRHQ